MDEGDREWEAAPGAADDPTQWTLPAQGTLPQAWTPPQAAAKTPLVARRPMNCPRT